MELLKTLCVRNYSYFNRSIMMSYNTVLGTRFVGTHLHFNLFAPPYPLVDYSIITVYIDLARGFFIFSLRQTNLGMPLPPIFLFL